MQLMLMMQQHFAQLLHLSEANLSRQRENFSFCGRSCCNWMQHSLLQQLKSAN
jgi:hypothetical protein